MRIFRQVSRNKNPESKMESPEFGAVRTTTGTSGKLFVEYKRVSIYRVKRYVEQASVSWVHISLIAGLLSTKATINMNHNAKDLYNVTNKRASLLSFHWLADHLTGKHRQILEICGYPDINIKF